MLQKPAKTLFSGSGSLRLQLSAPLRGRVGVVPNPGPRKANEALRNAARDGGAQRESSSLPGAQTQTLPPTQGATQQSVAGVAAGGGRVGGAGGAGTQGGKAFALERSLSTLRRLHASFVEALGDTYMGPVFKFVALAAGAGLTIFAGFQDLKSSFASLESKTASEIKALDTKMTAEIKVLETKMLYGGALAFVAQTLVSAGIAMYMRQST